MSKWNDLLDIFEEKFQDKSKQDKQDQIRKASIIRRILELSEEYLTTSDASFVFEVTPNNAPYMLGVLQDKQITERYDIEQVGQYLYAIRLKTFRFD